MSPTIGVAVGFVMERLGHCRMEEGCYGSSMNGCVLIWILHVESCWISEQRLFNGPSSEQFRVLIAALKANR